jgi:hypothetical protein
MLRVTMTFHRPEAADESENRSDLSEAEHPGRALRRLLTDPECQKLLDESPHIPSVQRGLLQPESQR